MYHRKRNRGHTSQWRSIIRKTCHHTQHTYSHATPNWLANFPTATRDNAIRNLHTFVTKAHNYREIRTTQNKYPYVEKWLSNDQINQNSPTTSGKYNQISDAQITQTLKFRYAQYIGNHRKNIFWPLKFQNPNCTLCHKNGREHMAPLTINVWTPLPERTQNSPPHTRRYTSSLIYYKPRNTPDILHINKCRQYQQY